MTVGQRTATAALSGQLSAVSLFDLCQFLMLNRKTGTLIVRSGSAVAYLTFQDGQLMTARDESRRDGDDVVLRAVQWQEGGFEFSLGPVSPERRIRASTESILLEAARKIDEMQAENDSGRSAGAVRTSQEIQFRETQQRAATLSDAFRTAVSSESPDQQKGRWQEEALRSLQTGASRRILVDPSGRVSLVSEHGARRLEGARGTEVEAWLDELLPRDGADRARPRFRSGLLQPRLIRASSGCNLWGARGQSLEGGWAALGLANTCFPRWSDLALPEELWEDLVRDEGGVTAVLDQSTGQAGSPFPVRAIVAAYLARQAQEQPRSVWVVEAWPEYDWLVLPGHVSSVHPVRLLRPGTLDQFCRAGATQALVLFDLPSHALAAESADLALRGLRVLHFGRCGPEGAPGPIWTVTDGEAPGSPWRVLRSPAVRSRP
jgi:hypothetical protein